MSDFFAYFQAIIPLTLAHLAVPPLSTFQQINNGQNGIDIPPIELAPIIAFVRSITPERLLDPNLILSLINEKVSLKKFQNPSESWLNYRLLTHLFVHWNYAHLINNLTTLLSVGQPLYREKRITFFYTTFFAGGIAASLPLFDAIQARASSLSNAPTSNSKGVLTLNDIFRNGAKTVLDLVTPIFNIETKYVCCGSSGAISAILGGSTVITCKGLFTSLVRVYSLLSQPSSQSTELLSSELLQLCHYLLTLPFTIEFIHSQVIHYQQQKSLIRQQQSSFFPWNYFSNNTMVDYEAHLQGFCFGALLTIGSYLWSGYSQNRRDYWENRSFRTLR